METYTEKEIRQMKQHDDLCYCTPGATGHVHAAIVSDEVWARGVLAIDALSQGNMATWAPRLSARNRRIAEKILKSKGL